MTWLRLHVPVQHLEISTPEGIGFWQFAESVLDSGAPVIAELTVRQGPGLPTFGLKVPLTHVTVTTEAATFIGTVDNFTVAGAVFYRNQRHGFLQVASRVP